MHLILEYSEEGSTQTLYCHGMEHVFQLPRLPKGCTDEARERDPRLGKRFAHLTSTVADKSIEETLGHEMYVTFLGRRARRCEVHFWHPERRGTKVTMVTKSAEDSAASFDIGPVSDSAPQRSQPMRAFKLHRRIVVDASNSSDPDPTASDSSGNSSMASSDASSHTDSGDSTSTGTPSITSSSSSSDSLVPAAPRQKSFAAVASQESQL